jgi:hypothetical protein
VEGEVSRCRRWPGAPEQKGKKESTFVVLGLVSGVAGTHVVGQCRQSSSSLVGHVVMVGADSGRSGIGRWSLDLGWT